MNNKFLKMAFAGVVLGVSGFVNAGLITISGYDIENASVSGTGGWGHTYNGTITPTSGSEVDYSGGSGTLNDGVIGTSMGTDQLFNYPADYSPIITIYLDGFYFLNNLLISGGNMGDNFIPGVLIGLDVKINSINESFVTASQGLANSVGIPVDDFVNFSGSTLDGLRTNKIILSNFVSTYDPSYPNVFSIAEITIDGTIDGTIDRTFSTSVPEPSTLAIFALGLMGLASRRFMKKS
jgi:hypothetical protein